MRKKKVFLIFTLVFSFFLVTLSFAADPTPQPTPDAATIEKAKSEYLSKICSGHGGVNCSVINKDATITCGDGTIDNSLPTIYAVPQCQEIIKTRATAEANFMAESGCFPPYEMTCINSQSYQNLYNHLSSLGVANSELGKGELAQCTEDIKTYEKNLANYKTCLSNTDNSNFEPSGKIVLPMLKVAFCPIYYGPNSEYSQSADLCLCDEGYFVSGQQCIQADKLCKNSYGPDAYAQQGNCIVPKNTPIATTVATPEPVAIAINSVTPTPVIYYYSPGPEISSEPAPTGDSIQRLDTVFLGKIFEAIINGFKKVLNLF